MIYVVSENLGFLHFRTVLVTLSARAHLVTHVGAVVAALHGREHFRPLGALHRDLGTPELLFPKRVPLCEKALPSAQAFIDNLKHDIMKYRYLRVSDSMRRRPSRMILK